MNREISGRLVWGAALSFICASCATAKMEVRTQSEVIGTPGQVMEAYAGKPALLQRRLQVNPTLRLEEEIALAGGVYPPQLLTPRVLGPWHFYTFEVGTRNVGDFFCFDADKQQFQIWMDTLNVCDTGRASKTGVAVTEAEIVDPSLPQLMRELEFVGLRGQAAHFVCKEQRTAREQDAVVAEIVHPLGSSGNVMCSGAEIKVIAASSDVLNYEVVRGFPD